MIIRSICYTQRMKTFIKEWIGFEPQESEGKEMTHILKLSEDYIKPVLNREKTFEVRFNDRGFQKGDLIKFTAITRDCRPYIDDELESRTYEITYVHSGLGLKEGYVVLGIIDATIEAAINPTQDVESEDDLCQ